MRTRWPLSPHGLRGAWLIAIALAQGLLCAVPGPIAAVAGRAPGPPRAEGPQGPVEEHLQTEDGQRAVRTVVPPRLRVPRATVRERAVGAAAPRAPQVSGVRMSAPRPLTPSALRTPLRC